MDTQQPQEAADGTISPEEYAKFIQQIELEDIWLHSACIENNTGPQTPKRADIKVPTSAQWTMTATGFSVFHAYQITFEDGEFTLASIEVVFGVNYSSGIEMSQELFAIFEEVNLPVNTWPYMREYLANTMGRMGWTPFTLPSLKRGTGNSGSRKQRRRRERAKEISEG